MCNGRGQAWINNRGAYSVVRCDCPTCSEYRNTHGTISERAERHYQRALERLGLREKVNEWTSNKQPF